MARETSITQEQINAAADTIRAEGTKPTARLVRERIGTGSMATILKFLQIWQSGQVKPAAQDVTLPPILQRYLVDFVAQEVSAARAGLDADLVAIQQAQADLIAESERQASTIEAQAEALELAQAEKAELSGRLGQMESGLAKALEDAIQERKAAETARTELAKAQLKLEALPRIEAEADRLRNELDIERRGRVEAEQNAAVLQAKLDAEIEHRKKAETQLVNQVRHFEDANKRALAASDALGDERVSTETLKARIEAVTRDVDEAKKEAVAARAAAQKAGEEAAELRGKLATTTGKAPAKTKQKPG